MSGAPRELGPGEIALVGPCVDGHQPFVHRTASGETKTGMLVPADCHHEGVQAYLEMGEHVGPGVRKVKQFIPFTARGPARVASPAYRSGWEAIFGNTPAKDDGCGPSQAN